MTQATRRRACLSACNAIDVRAEDRQSGRQLGVREAFTLAKTLAGQSEGRPLYRAMGRGCSARRLGRVNDPLSLSLEFKLPFLGAFWRCDFEFPVLMRFATIELRP